MPAFTSNLNLYKPGGGSTGLITPDEVVDVDRFNQNLDLLDAHAGNVLGRLTRQGGSAANAGARDAAIPVPVQGDTIYRVDLGYFERYYDTYNATTNPSGAGTAGWYPAPGTDISGKFVKTNNFQALTSTGAVITGMAARFVRGGISLNTSTNVVTLPVAGVYRIGVQVYGSGSDLNLVTLGFNSSGFGPVVGDGPVVRLLRTSAATDMANYCQGFYEHPAGKTLRLIGTGQSGSPNIYGGSSNQGEATFWDIQYLGPRQS